MARYQIKYWMEAADDLEKATAWYSANDLQLANRFRNAVRQTLQSIQRSPKLWAADEQGIRKVQVKPFSYHVAYYLRGDIVEIFAIGHASRDERYWQERLDRREDT